MTGWKQWDKWLERRMTKTYHGVDVPVVRNICQLPVDGDDFSRKRQRRCPGCRRCEEPHLHQATQVSALHRVSYWPVPLPEALQFLALSAWSRHGKKPCHHHDVVRERANAVEVYDLVAPEHFEQFISTWKRNKRHDAKKILFFMMSTTFPWKFPQWRCRSSACRSEYPRVRPLFYTLLPYKPLCKYLLPK